MLVVRVPAGRDLAAAPSSVPDGVPMIESMTDIPTSDGAMDTFIVHPEEGGSFPVFVLMDIWGLREEMFDIARRIAASGYYCVLPNFWYRRGKVRFEYRDDKGKMLSMKDLSAEAQAELHTNMKLCHRLRWRWPTSSL